jgi:hypothetical protein
MRRVEKRQRALAAQVPPLVEKHWQCGPADSLLRKVPY